MTSVMRILLPLCLLATVLMITTGRKYKNIDIGAFLGEVDSQLNLPLNHLIYKSSFERKGLSFNVSFEAMPRNDPFKSHKKFCEMIESIHSLAAVLVGESSSSSPVVQIIATRLQIPYLRTSWLHPSSFIVGTTTTTTALNFYPDWSSMSHGLAALVVRCLQWKSFTVLYQNTDGLIRLQEIIQSRDIEMDERTKTSTAKRTPSKVVVKHLRLDEDYRTVLKSLKRARETNIVLDCETGRIMEILERAKLLGLMTFAHNYFITSLDSHTLNLDSLDVDANITTVRIINPQDEVLNSLTKSWEYNEFRFSRFLEVNVYDVKTETALIYDATSTLIEVINEIEKEESIEMTNFTCANYEEKFAAGPRIVDDIKQFRSILPLTGYAHFDSDGRRIGFNLYMIEGNRNRTIAVWNSSHPESVQLTRSKEDAYNELLQTLQKGTKIVVARVRAPYFMYKKDPVDENDKFEGYAVDLMTNIAELMKFNYEFRALPDIDAAEFDRSTGEWKGVIGEIVNQKAHFALGDTTITPEREEVVDFSMPYMRLGLGILLKKPESTTGMFNFFLPLSVEVWMYTGTLYLVTSVVLYFVARMAPGDWENPHPCDLQPDELENIWELKNCLWLTMASIMNQGSDILPKGIASRLVASMWWFFALIMTNSYIASLAAFLTNNEAKIDDLEALAKQNRIKYGTLKGGASEDFFAQSNYSTYVRMYANMKLSEPSVFVDSINEGVRRVESTKDGLYAFFMESSTIDYLVARNCNLTTVSEKYFNNKEYGIAMPMGSPYRGAINEAILQLQEKQVLTRLKNLWWREKYLEHQCQPKMPANELRFEDIGGIFLLLAFGLIVALLLGIMEFLWTVRKESVEHHISFWTSFKIELAFALKIWISKKRRKSPEMAEGSSESSTESESKRNKLLKEFSKDKSVVSPRELGDDVSDQIEK